MPTGAVGVGTFGATRMTESPSTDHPFEDDDVEFAADDRWLTEKPILDAALPADIARLLGRLLNDDPVTTLGAWVTQVRRHTGGGSIAVDDLCHTDVDSPHRGELDGETYGFRCFYDAVVLAALADKPVDIRTESPGGVAIEAIAAGTDHLRVTPPAAVFSFGVDEAVEPPEAGAPSNADVYAAVCPYVKAFPDPAAYEAWAETVEAATVAIPLTGATAIAGALVEPSDRNPTDPNHNA